MPDKPEISELDKFIEVAATQGVDMAAQLHGTGIDEREIEALRKLSPQELSNLRDLNSKISNAATGGLATAWECGVIC